MSQATAIAAALGVTDVRRLWLSQLFSEVGDWAAKLALAVLVYDQTQSTLLSAAVVGVSVLPYVFSPWLTAFTQRWPLQSTLVGADVIRMVVFALAAFPQPPWTLLVLAFVAGLATPPYEANRSAVMAEAAGEEHLGGAVTVAEITLQSAQIVGFGVGGLMLATVGAHNALLLNAATFGISALFVTRLRAGRHRSDEASVHVIMRRAFSKLVGVVVIRQAVLVASLGSLADSMVNAVLPAFVRIESLPIWVLTLLVVVSPLTGVIAALIVKSSGTTRQLLLTGTYFMLIPGAISAALFVVAAQLTGAALVVVMVLAVGWYGLTIASGIPLYTLVVRTLAPKDRAPASAIIQPIFMGAQAVGAFVAGALAVAVAIPYVQAIGVTVAAVYAAWVVMRPGVAGDEPATAAS